MDADSLSLRVVNGGTVVELTVKFPVFLTDLQLLHKMFLSSDDSFYKVYHPEFIRFQENLRHLRSKSTDWVESMACIALPFPVETHIHKNHNFAWRDNSTKLLYNRLKAALDNYAEHNDNDKFNLL